MYSKKINQLATNLNPQGDDLIPIGDAITGQLKTTTFNNISGISSDGVISGGIVTWTGTGLIFDISECTYYLNGIRYVSPFSTKTLAAADPTNPRIDVFAVNTSGQVEVIQGTPAANPVEPEGDTATTLGLTNVTINAGATTPTGVTRQVIYDENLSSPTEWSKSAVSSGATFNYGDTSFPYTGTKSILVSTVGSGYIYFLFDKGSVQNISNFNSVSFAIRLNSAWTASTTFSIQFYNGANIVSNTYTITANNTVGFNRTLVGVWQFITIPLNGTLIQFTSNSFTIFRIGHFSGTITYRLDTISLNSGINNPTGPTTSNSFGFVNGSTGSAASTQATDTLNVVGTGLATTSATGKTLTIAVPSPIPSQTGNNGKYLTTDGSALSWATVAGGAMAIGGSITSATAGSVLFAGTSGVLQQDNANLFWDDTNNRLGIAINTPEAALHVNTDLTTATKGFVFTRTSLSSTNANFEFGNGTNNSGQLLPTLRFTSNFLSGSTSPVANWTMGGFFSGIITNSTIEDIGLAFDARTKSATALTQGWLFDFRSFTTTFAKMSFNGNLILQNGGTFTNAGYRLDVNGTARIIGNTSIGATSTRVGTASSLLLKTSDNTGATPSLGFFRPDGLTGIDIFYDGTVNSLNFKYNTLGTLTNIISIGQAGFSVSGTLILSNGLSFSAGNINVEFDKKIFLRSLPEWFLGYDSTLDEIRTSTRNDATNRYITLGGTTTGGVWSPVLSVKPNTANVGIGVKSPTISAKLDITSTTQGFLPPRMTTTQKNAIGTPAQGLMVFDTTLVKLCVYSGTAWETITSL